MAIRRNLEGLASLFPPSQRPYTPWLKDDLVRDSIPQDDLASLLQGLGGTGTTGPLGGPSSVGIDLPPEWSTNRIGGRPRPPRRSPTGFFSNLPTSPPGSISDLLGGMGRYTTGPSPEQTTGGDQIFGPSGGTVPPPPPTAGPIVGPTVRPEAGADFDTGQFEPQPPSKAQRIRQLKAQVRALEDQIRQIMLQIRELQGGGRSWTPEAPPGIGMNPPPTPPTPWKPPLGG